MKFKDKSPGMQAMLDNMSRGIFGRTVTESLDHHICVACAAGTGQLQGDDLQEYELSALCPTCFKLYGC